MPAYLCESACLAHHCIAASGAAGPGQAGDVLQVLRGARGSSHVHHAGHCRAATGGWTVLPRRPLAAPGAAARAPLLAAAALKPLLTVVPSLLLLLPLALQASAVVVSQAKAALDNPRLCGEPQLRDTAGDGSGAAAAFGATTPGGGAADEGLMGAMRRSSALLPVCFCWARGSHLSAATTGHHSNPCPFPHHLAAGFDMGAVVPVAEPDWSGAHHGLCLYASRVLQAVWDEQARTALLLLLHKPAVLLHLSSGWPLYLCLAPAHPPSCRCWLCVLVQVVVPMRGSPQLLKCKLSLDALQASRCRRQPLGSWHPDNSTCGAGAGGSLSSSVPASSLLTAAACTALHCLQSLEDKLRALDAFLGDYLQRRRGRRPVGGAAADGTALPAAKRQRLEDAQQAELKR